MILFSYGGVIRGRYTAFFKECMIFVDESGGTMKRIGNGVGRLHVFEKCSGGHFPTTDRRSLLPTLPAEDPFGRATY